MLFILYYAKNISSTVTPLKDNILCKQTFFIVMAVMRSYWNTSFKAVNKQMSCYRALRYNSIRVLTISLSLKCMSLVHGIFLENAFTN